MELMHAQGIVNANLEHIRNRKPDSDYDSVVLQDLGDNIQASVLSGLREVDIPNSFTSPPFFAEVVYSEVLAIPMP